MVTPCPIDPGKPASFPGNSYYCPDTNADGSKNTFTECCHNDRPDENGNYHSCCQSAQEREEEMLSMVEEIGVYIGIATGVLIILVFVCTYCRDDTFSCLKGLRAHIYTFWDNCVDGLCNCRFLSRRARRKLLKKKKKDLQKQYIHESNRDEPEPIKDDFFW